MLHLVLDALRRTCYCMIAFLAFLLMMPNLPPYGIELYKGAAEPPNIPFTGGLTPNHRLETAEPLSRGIRETSSLGYFKVIITITAIRHNGTETILVNLK